jgi:hypothetical protein
MSSENTKIWQKTRVINATSASAYDVGALVVQGGLGVWETVKIGPSSGSLLSLSSTGLTSNVPFNIATSAGALTVSGASTVDITSSSGNLALTSTGGSSDINFVSGSNLVNFGTKMRINTNTNTITSVGSNDLNIESAVGQNINLAPASNQTVKITTGGYTPMSDNDVVTKAYVDSVVEGLDVKEAVRARLTNVTLPANTMLTASILTADVNGAIGTIDGITFVLNDRILYDQAVAPQNNGIYRFTDLGSPSTPWVLTRTIDANAPSEINPGSFTFVKEGSHAGNGYVVTAPACTVLNTDPITFAQFSSAGVFVFNNVGTGQDIFNQSTNNINFYRLAAATTSNVATAPLTITNAANTTTFTLDLEKFTIPIVLANNTGGIILKPFNDLTTFGTTPNTIIIDTSPTTKTISTGTGKLVLEPANNILDIGNTNTISFDVSSGVSQTITSSDALSLISTSTNDINLEPGSNVTRFGSSSGQYMYINSSAKTITTSTGNLKLLPSTGITILSIPGEANGVTVDTSTGNQTITGSGDLTLAAGGIANDVIINPSSGFTIFYDTTNPVQIDAPNGLINRVNAPLRLSTTTSAGVEIYPFSKITTFSSVASPGDSFTINTAPTNQILTTSGGMNLVSGTSADISIKPASQITNFGNSSEITVNTSTTPKVINSTVALTVSTTADGVLIDPGNDITTFGTGSTVTVNNSSGAITTSGVMTLAASGTNNIAINPTTNITTFNGTVSINTSNTPKVINATTALDISTNAGDITFIPAGNDTIFGTTNTVTITDTNGTITTSGQMNLVSSTSTDINVKPNSQITTFGNASEVQIKTGLSPKELYSTVALAIKTNAGDLSILPASTITNFGATMTVNTTTNPTITATSGNMVLTSAAAIASINGATGVALNTTSAASNITLTTSTTGQTIISSGTSTPSTSYSTGTLYVQGTAAANTGGLGVNGAIFARESINTPIYSNGASGTTVSLRANTADATGKILLPTTRINYGNSTEKYAGSAVGSKAFTGTSIVDVFTVVIPASTSCYLNIEVVVNDGSSIYIYSSKVLVNVDGTNVTTYVNLFDAITDSSFSIDIATANTFILQYDPVAATSKANIWVQYMTTGATDGDITSITL